MMNVRTGSICKLSGFFKCKLLGTHDARTINPYFNVDFVNATIGTILPASVGLTQARPNKVVRP